MIYFEYDKASPQAEYYEILQGLMERWEYEIVEFKEAKGGYNEDKIGQYFSAISNEANLKGQQYGWFVLGVSESGQKRPVGTAFKQGKQDLIEKFKYSISKDLTDGITFLEVVELFPIVAGMPKRVLMFKIPASAVGIPTEWKTKYYARSGDSLVDLPQAKLDIIRSQQRKDWSRTIIQGSSIRDLDAEAIAFARQKYKEKMNKGHISEEIDSLSDEEFLTKMKLMKGGHVTNAAMVLLGSEEHDDLFDNAPSIMWRLYGSGDEMKDYEIFKVPFITVVDKVFTKIRNLTYRYMTNQMSLFPKETQQYDLWLLRELLNNCIAHSNYQLGGRIYVNEEEDSISITNPGDFLPKSIETVLQKTYNPPFYRNQLLADSMVKFGMIDTATSGIKKVYRIQKDKYFPMPDYDLTGGSQVSVKVYGKIIDEKYTFILFNRPELELETIYLLDQIQKGNNISQDAVTYLRKHHLVEGRKNNLYLSAGVSEEIDEQAKYIKNKGFDDQYYKDMIVEYLRKYGKAQKKDFRDLLWDKLPDVLDSKKKNSKITTLLTALRIKGIITTDSPNQQISNWILVGDDRNSNKK
jgi:ATP-dependent DNA helicase RecG